MEDMELWRLFMKEARQRMSKAINLDRARQEPELIEAELLGAEIFFGKAREAWDDSKVVTADSPTETTQSPLA